MTAKGRTRNVPQGYLCWIFANPTGKAGNFPKGESFRGNRSFSIRFNHLKSRTGAMSLGLYILPDEDAEKLEEFLKQRAGNRSSDNATLEKIPKELLANSILVGSVPYHLTGK